MIQISHAEAQRLIRERWEQERLRSLVDEMADVLRFFAHPPTTCEVRWRAAIARAKSAVEKADIRR